MYVLFLDLLGFASSLDQLGDSDTVLTPEFFNPLELSNSMRTEKRAEIFELYRLYRDFHSVVQEAARSVRTFRESAQGSIAIFEFSDSIFFTTSSPSVMSKFCIRVMNNLYAEEVPARGGLAYGSFTFLPVSMEQSPSGDLTVQCPFLGSAVVRAYRTEKCGLKGLRIFVHSSCIKQCPDYHVLPLMKVPKDEKNEHATHELNFFEHNTSSYYYHQLLHKMKDRASAEAYKHYDASVTATIRMENVYDRRSREY